LNYKYEIGRTWLTKRSSMRWRDWTSFLQQFLWCKTSPCNSV